MPDYGLHILWSTPIVKVKNPDHARIKPGLMKFAYDSERSASQKIESGVTPHIKSELYESKMDIFTGSTVPEIQALAQFCMQSVGEIAGQLRAKLRPQAPLGQIGVMLHESWVHITRDRGYHDMHTHPNCSWCGIYCIDPGDSTFDPPNGTNRFDSPIEPNYIDLGSEAYIESSLYVCPEEGLLVLFPSYLRHSATPYRGTKDRIVIAFNSRVYQPGETR